MITTTIVTGSGSQCTVHKQIVNTLHNICHSLKMEFIKGTESFRPDNKWRGVNVNKLCRNDNTSLYPPVKPSAHHTVAVELPVIPGVVPKPFKKNTDETWTQNHVHLPFSDKNIVHLEENNVRKRWELIQEALLRPINNSTELEEAICLYNQKKWKFPALHYLFSRELEEEETAIFFQQLMPKIIRLALRLPELLQCGIPLLKTHSNHSITLSQLQIASLLANAFLCTYPRRNCSQSDSQYSNYPCINFSRLFQARSSCVSEKLKCLINYFTRVTTKEPTGLVTYSRRFIPFSELPRWCESKRKMPDLFISSEGMIENQTGLLQVDFANKFVGGGVLGHGGVQEEIRFVICPELIAAQLFTECLTSTEALIVSGIERFNQYEGYASSFTWTGSYKDETPSDMYGRKMCTVLAIDASDVSRNPRAQYSLRAIQRELNKAYVGFSWGCEDPSRRGNTVATGNWGCGAFKGDVQLKALVQLMSAGQASANVAYFTFGNAELTRGIYDMYELLRQFGVSVGNLFELLGRYEQYVKDGAHERITLYEFLYSTIVVDKIDLSQSTSSHGSQTKSSNASGSALEKVADKNDSSSSNVFSTPDKAANVNKQNPSPDFSDIFRTKENSSRTDRNSFSENNKGSLSSKSSSSFYASSSKLRISNGTHDSNRNNSHRNCNGAGSYAVIDDMLKEAERCEELRQKRIGKRNINSSQTTFQTNTRGNIERNGEQSETIGSSNHRKTEAFSRISALDENFSEDSENKHGRANEEEIDSHKSHPNSSKSSPGPIKSSYFTNDRISSLNSVRNSLRTESNAIDNNLSRSSTKTSNSCNNLKDLIFKQSSTNSVPCNNRKTSFSKLNVPSCSKDFVIQIEEEYSRDRSPSPDVINSSIAETPVKYTQDLFSEDEDMEVDEEDLEEKCDSEEVVKKLNIDKEFKTMNNKFNGDREWKTKEDNKIVKAFHKSNKSRKSIPSDHFVQNTQDIFSEDDDDKLIGKFDSKNNNFKQKSIARSKKRNNCDSSVENVSRNDETINKTANKITAQNMSENKALDNITSTNDTKVASVDNTSKGNNSTDSDSYSSNSETDNNISMSTANVSFNKSSTHTPSHNSSSKNHYISTPNSATKETSNSVSKESEEVKLFKRIQRNSWADLERSRKDMKCEDIEKEIQIMDTSDELSCSVRPNDSPKIRKTDKNISSAARSKNKKITDYFSKEVRK